MIWIRNWKNIIDGIVNLGELVMSICLNFLVIFFILLCELFFDLINLLFC